MTHKVSIFPLWVDECLFSELKTNAKRKPTEFSKLFEMTDVTPDGKLTEYVGYKVEYNNN